MRRMLAGLLALSLVVMVLAAPTPALAGGRFWTGLAVGGVTGLVLGSGLAKALPVGSCLGPRRSTPGRGFACATSPGGEASLTGSSSGPAAARSAAARRARAA